MQINLSNVFIEIENFLFQLLFFLVSFPKMFLKSIINPKWIHNYIIEELKKEQKDQFKDYINPLYFFVISFFIVTITADSLLANVNSTPSQIYSSFDFVVWSIFYLVLPIPFAVTLLKINKHHINNVEYRQYYYIQLIIFGITLVLLAFIFLATTPFLKGTGGEIVSFLYLIAIPIMFIVLGMWFVVAQIIVFYNEIILNPIAQKNKFQSFLKSLFLMGLCSVFDIIIIANYQLINNVAKTIAGSFHP